jgi:hypothetical protein
MRFPSQMNSRTGFSGHFPRPGVGAKFGSRMILQVPVQYVREIAEQEARSVEETLWAVTQQIRQSVAKQMGKSVNEIKSKVHYESNWWDDISWPGVKNPKTGVSKPVAGLFDPNHHRIFIDNGSAAFASRILQMPYNAMTSWLTDFVPGREFARGLMENKAIPDGLKKSLYWGGTILTEGLMKFVSAGLYALAGAAKLMGVALDKNMMIRTGPKTTTRILEALEKTPVLSKEAFNFLTGEGSLRALKD